MLLYQTPEVTISGDLDGQGRIQTVRAEVRRRCKIVVEIEGFRPTFAEVLEVGSHSLAIPVGRRSLWGDSSRWSIAVATR